MTVKAYVIEKRGNRWCLLTHDRSRVLGCHDTREEAEAQERAVQAGKVSGEVTLPRVAVATLCPPCAEAMAAKGITALTIPYVDWTHGGMIRRTYRFDAPHLYQFNQGLCERFGGDEGFHTRCSDAMEGRVDDVGAFCAALKDFCHPGTRPWMAQDGASRAHDADAPRFTVEGVEVFRVGTWNGDAYSAADLDAMVAAFLAVGFTPPVHLGHEAAEGAPAVAWLTNLRHEGDALVADLVDIPQAVYEAIRGRGYDALSAEIYWDLERNGITYPRVLKSVALLGAHVPAVDLAPLSARLQTLPTAPSRRYTVTKEGRMDPVIQQQLDALKAQVTTLAAENGKLKEQVTLLGKGTDAEALTRLSVENVNARAEATTAKQALELERAAARKAKAASLATKVIIPALRPTIQAIYEAALADPTRVVKFSADATSPAVDTPPAVLVEALVDLLNGPAARLFQTYSQTGVEAAVASASAAEQLAAKANAYATAHTVPFDQALAVIRKDPANAHLVAAYAASVQ